MKNAMCKGPGMATAMLVLTIMLLLGSKSSLSAPPAKASAMGDSITMGFAAVCKKNKSFWNLFCLLRGDRPNYSWFDGGNADVMSVAKRFENINPDIDTNKRPARSGSELRGGSNNFAVQAEKVIAESTVADHVQVLLGGNDICNRKCVDPRNCRDPLYTEAQWRESLRRGLDILVAGLPQGSTIYLGSVPRVQDLRAAGLEKQAKERGVNCESIWRTFGICSIVTRGGNYNGESLEQRLDAVNERQRQYNEIIKAEATAYTANSRNQNPRGIEVIAEYRDENTLGVGTYRFNSGMINGGDCFHPNVVGQDLVAEYMWRNNSDR